MNYSLLYDSSNLACDVPNPPAVDISLITCSLISIPAYLLVVMAFRKKTPENFKIYKRKLIVCVIANICLEISITILVKPVVYFPEIALRAGGIHFLRHCTGAVSFFAVFITVIVSAYSLLGLFHYRMTVVVEPWKYMHNLKILKIIRIWSVVMHISIVISLFSFYFILQVFLEQPVTKLRSSTLRSLPEYSCLSFLVVPTLSEQSLSTWLNMQAFNFLVVVPNFLMFWLAILMVYTTAKFLSLLKKEAQISTFFMNFHKLYLRSLIIQMVVHSIIVGIPALCYSAAAIYNIGHSVFTLLSIIVISLHGSVLSLLIIWMNKPLRLNLISYFSKEFRLFSLIVISIHGSVIWMNKPLRQNLVSYFSRAMKMRPALGEISNNSRTVTRWKYIDKLLVRTVL